MDLNITGPFNELQPEHLNVLDDVVKSFSESLDSVLKTNFKPQKRADGNLESVASASVSKNDSSSTKNQRVAAIFCRQWLTGVLNELTAILAKDTLQTPDFDPTAMLSTTRLVEVPELSDPSDAGVYVGNVKPCGDGQFEVDYAIVQQQNQHKSLPGQRSKLKAHELLKLLNEGKKTEYDLEQNLANFWKHSLDHAMQLLKQPGAEEKAKEKEKQETRELPFDVAFLDNVDKIVNEAAGKAGGGHVSASAILDHHGNANAKSTGRKGQLSHDDALKNLELLRAEAQNLNLVGVDELIKLYHRLQGEIKNVSKSSAFFATLINDMGSSSNYNNQVNYSGSGLYLSGTS